ncbi:hypothetical protein [Streptomyces cinereoruber]|uniref:hypothetical protein n=1 Tax=Streptomyces cinereoruber TaxID=67260 RepID=UPI003635C413
MTIEPVTELGSGGALQLPRARAVPMSAPPASYTAAVERYLTGAGIAKSSARIYRISLVRTVDALLDSVPPATTPAPDARTVDPRLPESLCPAIQERPQSPMPPPSDSRHAYRGGINLPGGTSR